MHSNRETYLSVISSTIGGNLSTIPDSGLVHVHRRGLLSFSAAGAVRRLVWAEGHHRIGVCRPILVVAQRMAIGLPHKREEDRSPEGSKGTHDNAVFEQSDAGEDTQAGHAPRTV